MARYETLKTITLSAQNTVLRSEPLPELVYLEDPAFAVMCDFSRTRQRPIPADETMDNALNEMKIQGVHLLLVQGENDHVQGVISSEDILGEWPIKIIQERRIKRSQITVKMVMRPIDKIAALDIKILEHAKVGHIVETLKNLRTHYVLVISEEADNHAKILRGIFTTSQISRQLHRDIADSIAKTQSLFELQKRKS
ncbi:MAG: hypothetical protein A3F41_05140 [Coxiella sp. RIFCSPHIGHO2_12_FULL_44_14]|nr:MAG: hypothetical protein A3F41_05140 [Coxiella sp. RIFCSPHIGHO2_12_FULL_44_14]